MYCAVWSTMIWFETNVVPDEVPDHHHRDVGLEQLGRVAVLTTSTRSLVPAATKSTPPRDAVHRPRHDQALEAEGLRPERGLAVRRPGRRSRSSRASCPAPSTSRKHEGAARGPRRPPQPPAPAPAPRRSAGRRRPPAGVARRPVSPASAAAGAAGVDEDRRLAHGSRRPPPGATPPVARGAAGDATAAAAYSGQDAEGDAVAGVDVAHGATVMRWRPAPLPARPRRRPADRGRRPRPSARAAPSSSSAPSRRSDSTSIR